MEEEKTLEEKAEVAEPVSEEEAEPTPELPGAEVSSEAETKTLQEQLAERVKACLIERSSCENLGSKLEDAAKELGIGLDELIDQVFEIISRKEG